MWKRVKKAKDAMSVEEAYKYSLRLLEFRFRGEDELRVRLKENGFAGEVISAVLGKLREYKYVDDERLLESLICEYKQHGLYGPVYIRQKLLQRKFAREQIDKVLARFYPSSDELNVAKQFLTKQQSVNLDDLKARRLLIHKLIRRGFAPGVAFRVVREPEPLD